jgi:deoxyribose-phosphate aldolase
MIEIAVLQQQTAARQLLSVLDLTDLSESCESSAVRRLCEAARTPFGEVAAICIFPQFVATAKALLQGSGVKVATVVNFPGGGKDIARATEEARAALGDGADEIDLVMPYRAFLRGEEKFASAFIATVAGLMAARQPLKVILETGALGDLATITRASDLAIDAGAHFLKTSTGKTAVSATPKAAEAMLLAIARSGKAVGFKAAGGIRTLADATPYLEIAGRIMGSKWACPANFRIGASSLLAALLAAISEPN